MNDEVDAFCLCNTDFEQVGRLIGADQHGEVIYLKNPDRVPVCVQHVIICDPVLACTVQNYRVHAIKLP